MGTDSTCLQYLNENCRKEEGAVGSNRNRNKHEGKTHHKGKDRHHRLHIRYSARHIGIRESRRKKKEGQGWLTSTTTT